MGNFPPETIDRGGLIEIPLCVEKVRNVRIDLNELGDGVALALMKEGRLCLMLMVLKLV